VKNYVKLHKNLKNTQVKKKDCVIPALTIMNHPWYLLDTLTF